MKALRVIAEAIGNLTVIAFGLTVMGIIGYYISQHVTCVDLVKWCIVH